MTLTDGPANYKRLQVNNSGQVKFVSTASNRTWESFTFTEVEGGNTSSGLNVRIEAEDYSEMSGILTQETADIGGGINVGWIDPNDWLEYTVTAPSAGSYTLNLRTASPNAGANTNIEINGSNVGSIQIPLTGDWQNWETIRTTINLEAGTQTLRSVSYTHLTLPTTPYV